MLNSSYPFCCSWCLSWLCVVGVSLFPYPAIAETDLPTELDIPPEIIKESPVLEKWLQETPDVLHEIYHEPSFRTRLNLGFSFFPTDDDITGIKLGIEDVFLGRTGLTVSGDYRTSFNGDLVNTGTDLHYFVLPLGSFINFAPLVGYRYVKRGDFDTDGVNLGLRLMLALSRTGAADISLAQSFVSPGEDREVGLFSIAVGYALSRHLRLSTDWQIQNSTEESDRFFSIGLQYLF